MLQEKVIRGVSGWAMLFGLIAGVVAGIAVLVTSSQPESSPWVVASAVLLLVVDGACWFGFTVVPPNTARVVLLFGNYKGSLKAPGFWWVNPLTTRRLVSLKVRNFESGKLKVNDHIGNPIEIAAIVVW